jgi:hypothetical protein
MCVCETDTGEGTVEKLIVLKASGKQSIKVKVQNAISWENVSSFNKFDYSYTFLLGYNGKSQIKIGNIILCLQCYKIRVK